jgi:hypothetical protein
MMPQDPDKAKDARKKTSESQKNRVANPEDSKMIDEWVKQRLKNLEAREVMKKTLEPQQPAPKQPEPKRPKSKRPVLIQPESKKPELIQPKPKRPESKRPVLIQPEPEQPEQKQPESKKPELIQPKPKRPESKRPVLIQPEPEQPEPQVQCPLCKNDSLIPWVIILHVGKEISEKPSIHPVGYRCEKCAYSAVNAPSVVFKIFNRGSFDPKMLIKAVEKCVIDHRKDAIPKAVWEIVIPRIKAMLVDFRLQETAGSKFMTREFWERFHVICYEENGMCVWGLD